MCIRDRYKHERRLVVPLLVSSTLLFYIGMAFAYFVVFPLAFGFLTHAAPEGVLVSTDIRSYLDFVMALFMAFGVSFEVPVAIVLLCWMGVTTPEDLRKKRPYVLVGAFVVGMLLTPPDVFSQTLLAIPMYCLFEVGVFFARFYTCLLYTSGRLYDKMRLFVDDMSAIGQSLDKAQESYRQAMKKLASGRGNLLAQAEAFRGLGVEVKRGINPDLVEQAIAQDDPYRLEAEDNLPENEAFSPDSAEPVRSRKAAPPR